MSVQERVIMCRLVEKMERQKNFSKKLKLENHTCFHGRPICKGLEKE
jgi:hypothetical protein